MQQLCPPAPRNSLSLLLLLLPLPLLLLTRPDVFIKVKSEE